MTARRIPGTIHAALAAMLLCAAPAFAQQTQDPPLDPQRFDPSRLQLNQDQLTRLRETIVQDPSATADPAELDARGRLLRRVDWMAAADDLSAQLERRTQSGRLTTAASPVQSGPLALPRNAGLTDLARPRLPMLLPETADAFTQQNMAERGMLVFPRDHAYSATYHHDGMMFEVSGSRVVAATIEDPRAVRLWHALREPDGLTLTPTETGLAASFTRYGAAYEIQLHCADPDSDPRCRDPETVRNVARRLVIAGGSPDGRYRGQEIPR